MSLANLNTADFIKGTGVTQTGRTIEVFSGIDPITGNGFTSYAYAVWSGTGLVFNVFYSSYYINNVLYPEGSGDITLDAADVTNDRFDTIAVDATGEIKITGTPSSDPVIPTVDNLTQLAITSVFVEANATTPTLITDLNVYKENVEFTGSSNIAGAEFNNTTTPFAGTYCVDIDSFTINQYVQFVDASTHEIADYGTLKFYLSLKASFSVNTGFIISFFNGSTRISTEFTLTRGVYQFDNTDVSGYQLIVIPLSEFTFSSSEFDTVYFKMKGENSSGFKLDNIVLQGGISGFGNLQNALTQIVAYESNSSIIASTPNSIFTFKGGDGFDVGVSATNELRFTQLPILAPTGTDTYIVNFPSLRQTYTAGLTYKLRVSNTNTGPSTLKINAYVTRNLVKNVSDPLVAGDLIAGKYYIIVYDGTNFQVIGIGGTSSGGGHTIQSNSTPLTDRPNLNVVGIDTTDDAPNSATKLELTGANVTGALGFTPANDADVVKLTGNQTIAGVKTFSSFPVTPSSSPTTSYQVANKDYVDTRVITESMYARIQAVWYHLNSF